MKSQLTAYTDEMMVTQIPVDETITTVRCGWGLARTNDHDVSHHQNIRKCKEKRKKEKKRRNKKLICLIIVYFYFYLFENLMKIDLFLR